MMNETDLLSMVNLVALDLLRRQTFIPALLLETRGSEAGMCTGAAVLFAAHLVRGGQHDITGFFADLATEPDDDFVETRARLYGLDPVAVRNVIINSKALYEDDRARAVPNILSRFVQDQSASERRTGTKSN